MLSLKFGAILRDHATIRINFIGFALNIAYTLFYYYYTPNNEKMKVWAQIGAAGAFAAGVIAYAQYEDPTVIEFRFGMIITLFLFALVASPFLSLVCDMHRVCVHYVTLKCSIFREKSFVIRVPLGCRSP